MGQMVTAKHEEASPGSSFGISFDLESNISELSTVLTTPTPPDSPQLSPADTPASSLHTSPDEINVSLPIRLKCLRDDGAPRTTEDVADAINHRRASFFSAMENITLPLLDDDDAFYKLIGSVNKREAKLQPRRTLQGQPAGLRATLKPYQLEGLSFLLYLHENGIGGILGDEMGLGKTLQTLSLFQYLKVNGGLNESNNSPLLVVCPLSVLETWISETSKWAPDLVALKYHGSQDQRAKIKKDIAKKRRNGGKSLPDIVITSYETLTSDSVWFRRAFVWRYVVLDEGHRIKNTKTQRALALGKIRADYKLVLTGTPLQNDLQELWSILHWMYPDVFVRSTVTAFEEAFSLNNGIFDHAFFEQVTEFLKVIMLRRGKDSPGLGIHIPKKTEYILSVPLSQLQVWWYLKIASGISRRDIQVINEATAGTRQDHQEDVRRHILEHDDTAGPARKIRISQNILMELRKCSIHPYLLEGALPNPYKVTPQVITDSGKFQVLYELVGRFVTENKKVIIFSGFEGALDLCEDMLALLQNSMGEFKYVRLDGCTSSARRNLSTYLFQNDKRYLVFLISIRAGGEGLNLVASSTVIFLDEDWNPQTMKQAYSRVHRIGQTKPVEIYRLQSRGTVEDQMSQRLEKKAYMADRVTENVRASQDYGDLLAMSLANIQNMMRPAQNINLKQNLETLSADHGHHSIGLGSCGIRQVNDQAKHGDKLSAKEEAWLERSERVRTNIFEGKRITRRTRTLSIFDEQLLTDFRREDRRIGKERTVIIDGFEVCKESLAPNEPLSSTRISSDSGAKDQLTHEATCFVCRNYNAVDCNLCPRAFHWECLGGKGRAGRFAEGLICPQHYCGQCDKTASQAGGLIFPCVSCEVAYCEHCLAWDQTSFVEDNHAYAFMGYTPGNAFFIRCAACQKGGARKRRGGDGAVSAAKRFKRR